MMYHANIFCAIMMACILSCLAGIFPAEASMLEMKDGTVLVGEIKVELLTIHTRYGVLNVPVSDIDRIVEGKIWLLNNSHFSGKIKSHTLNIKTEFGNLEISTDQIEWINFVKNELPKDE